MPTPSILLIPDRYKAAVLYSQIPDSGAVDFDVTRSTTAYRTNASGVLESVASGVPRLDYPIGGGCPSLLVEPAATNTFLYSEDFSDATWVKERISVSSNVTTAPDGTSTADKIVENTDNNSHRARQNANSTQNVVYTLSCYIKAAERSKARLSAGGINAFADFDLTTESVIGTPTLCTASIVSAGSGWYRCAITYTQTSATSLTQLHLIATLNAAGDFIYTGDGTSGIFIWGAQLETGLVATSYIPTVAATATRNADVISKTGVSGFIGQTEGTVYAEVDVSQLLGATARTFINIGSASNSVFLGFTSLASNTIRLSIDTTAGAGVVDFRVVVSSAGTIKVAAAYKNGDCALYVNGVAGTIVANGSISLTTISNLFLGQTVSSAGILNDRIRAAAIYPTRLSNSELAALTTL